MARVQHQTAGHPASFALLSPSGDTDGSTDTAAINAALIANRHVVLAPGDWYVTGVGLVNNDRWFQGSGKGTVIHAVSGATGLTVVGPGQITVSDMAFRGGDYGIVVNGAYDADFRNLHFDAQVLGGIKINGDLATEQHYTDIVMRNVGGIGFALDRTTTIYTGSLYMDRVRLVEPPASATVGFRFRSTASEPSLNICFMDQCVADNYTGDAMQMENCAQVFVSNSWFAINGSAPTNAAAIRITNGFQQTWQGNYTYSGKTTPSVVLSGNLRGIDIGGGHVFDGTPTTVAVGLTGATTYAGFKLGEHQSYCGGGITDTPGAMTAPAIALPGATTAHGEETFSRLFCNDAAPLVSGTLVLSYFTATKTELISTIEAMTNDSQAGGTYRGYGLYTVAPNGTLTLVAKAEQSGTGTLWNSGFQPIGGFDTRLALTALYQKVAGQRYAVGALFVGTTAPKLIAARPSNGTPVSNMPVTSTPLGQLAASRTGQATLGTIGTTTHTAAQLAGYGWMPYYVLN